MVTGRLLDHMRHERDTPEPLTPREVEVLTLLARGLPNKGIADNLYIGERTVKFHVSSILAKLDAANRTEAARIAISRGLIEQP
jgi:DNA-binding NarL/FixJ family response regulator